MVRDIFTPIIGPEGLRADGLLPYAVDGLEPRVLLRPADERQVAETLRAAGEHGLAVVVRGGGTQMGLGNPPRRLDAVLEMSRLGRLVDHQPADLTATAQAGITLGRLQEEMAKHGQMVPLDSPQLERATLGGTIAANATGPRRLAFGTARDVVLGVRVAHPDGAVTKAGGRVVKNVTGFDLNKLYVGSLGTLGAIVEVTVRVVPLPPVERTVVAAFSSLASATAASMDVLSRGLGLLALGVLSGAAARRAAAAAAPYAGHALVVAEAGGRQAAVGRRVDDVARLCREAGAAHVEVVEGGESRRLWREVGDMGWEDGAEAPAAVVRSSVLPTQVAGLCAALEETARHLSLDVGLVYLADHASGVVRSLWWPQVGEGAGPSTVEALASYVRVSAHTLGTHAVVERCGWRVKRHLDAWGTVEEVPLSIMRRLKERFDPRGVLSPGRFVGGI